MQLFLVHFRGYHMPGLWCLRGFVFARTQNPSLFHTQLCMDYVCELDATRQTEFGAVMFGKMLYRLNIGLLLTC